MQTETLETPTARPAPGEVRLDWQGVVRHLHLTPRAFLPMRAMPSLSLVAGIGIDGDRYMIGLTHLVGRRFWLGETLLESTRLSIPCRHIEEITGKSIFDPLINRSGLNCRILQGGTVRVGDAVRPA